MDKSLLVSDVWLIIYNYFCFFVDSILYLYITKLFL